MRLVLVTTALLLALVLVDVIGAGARQRQEPVVPSPVPTATIGPSVDDPPSIGALRTYPLPAGAAAHAHQCALIVESDCATAIATGAGSIWTTTADGVARIDPASGKVMASVRVGSFPHRLAWVDGSLWASVESPGKVVRIDPATSTLAASVDLGGTPVGIASDGTTLWVADTTGDRVVALDASTGKQIGSTLLGRAPWGVAVLDGSVWVSDRYGSTLWKVDPATRAVTATIKIAGTDSPEPLSVDLSAALGRLWLTGHDTVKVLDPTTNVVTKHPVPTWSKFIATDRAVWLVSAWNRVLMRLDPVTLEIEAEQVLPLADQVWDAPVTIADDGSLWVRDYGADAILRITPSP